MEEGSSQLQGKAAEYARILREHLPELRVRYGVKSLGIFGSYVCGEEQEGSDLDVLVEFSRSIGLFGFVGLNIDLSDLLGIKVDIVMKGALRRRMTSCRMRQSTYMIV